MHVSRVCLYVCMHAYGCHIDKSCVSFCLSMMFTQVCTLKATECMEAPEGACMKAQLATEGCNAVLLIANGNFHILLSTHLNH